MEKYKLNRIAGIVITVSIIFSMVGMILLSQLFEWEGKPIGMVLEMYFIGGSKIRFLWTLFGIGCLLIGPVALLLHKVLNSEKTPYLYIGTTSGVIASVAYIIGLTRWILLAGALAPLYSDPATTSSIKEIIETVFYSFNIYAGNGFGETLAPITHGMWLLFIGSAMLKSSLFPKGIALMQIIGGAVIMVRPLEYAGLKYMATIGDLGVQAWAILFLVVGFTLIRKSYHPKT